MRILLLTLLFITAICPAALAENNNQKFQFLLYFYDRNEEAFSYQLHCLSHEEGLNEKFLSTLRFVADELLAETIKLSPKKSPEYIRDKIIKRRYNIQHELDRVYVNLGCDSDSLDGIRNHYKEFSRYDQAEISRYIDEQTVGR